MRIIVAQGLPWHGHKLAQKYRVCTQCVMDTSNPSLEFDEQGRCQYCRYVENELIGKVWFPEGGETHLKKLIEAVKENGKSKPYDVLMGVSGGLDSSYLAYLAVKEWGLRPLFLHVDTGWNSEIAVGNVERLVRTLGVDLYTYVIDWETMKDLQRAYLLSGVITQDVPQDQAIIALLSKVARQFGIKHLFGGWNPSSESIGGMIELPGVTLTDSTNIRAIHRAYGRRSLAKYPMISFFQNYVYFPFIYRLRIHYPLRFMKFDSHHVREILARETGWRSYGQKHHESRWTRFYQNYYLASRYELDKRRIHLSSEIMAGNITREQALEELARPPFDPNTVRLDEDYVMKKLNLRENEYRDALARAPRHPNEFANESKWILALGALKRVFNVRLRS